MDLLCIEVKRFEISMFFLHVAIVTEAAML